MRALILSMRMLGLGMLTAVALAAMGGCGRAVSTSPNPISVTSAEYDKVFDAAVATLREMKFVVDRKDRRFGVVTTEPQIASSFFEPWYSDNTTGLQVWENTLNMQRRSVRVEIEPADGPVPPTDAAAASPAEATAAAPVDAAATSVGPVGGSGYRMRILVAVDRRQLPRRNLHTTALVPASTRTWGRIYKELETEREIERPTWQPLGRDEELERRLIDAILVRAQSS